MELFKGCSEDCDDSGCNKCLKFFEPLDTTTRRCNTEKIVKNNITPKYDFVGFGRFEKKTNSKKIYFMLYLKITTGIMYDARISFVLVRKSTGRRFLQDSISGTGIQSSVSLGSYSDNSSIKDHLVKFDCEAEDDEADSSYYLSYLQLDKANDEELNAPITSQKFSKQDISKYTTDKIENLYVEGSYIFSKKSTRLLSNERRLLSNSQKCLLSGNQASFSLIGDVYPTVETINKDYTVGTNVGKNLACTLNKEKTKTEASLDCTMDEPVRGFNISEDEAINEDGTILSFDPSTTETLLCQTFYSESDKSGSSSGGGLSGGAIAGIVIVCIVIVAAIGVVLYFIKSGKADDVLNEASSGISKAGENSNYALPNENTTSKFAISK